MIVNKIAEYLGEMYGHVKSIYEGQKEYARLTIIQQSSKVSSMFIIAMIFMLIVFLILLMLCFSLAAYLYTLFNSISLAFLATSGILILLLILIYIFRHVLISRPVLNGIIRYIDKRT